MAEPLLTRIANGDSTAVDECIDLYGNLIWSLARRLSPTTTDAEDAVQEIFVEIWRKAASYNPALSSEATFITMIARRRLIDRHRRQTRRPETVTMDEQHDRAGGMPVNSVELAEEFNKAHQCLQQLKPDERKVLELSIFQQLSQASIAEVMKIPLGTVKTHARRGINRLRDMLGAEAISGGVQ